jgi:hypothetical protein
MAGVDRNAPVEEPDPTEDTPEPDDEEGAEADAQPEPDQSSRLTEAQATITRQAQELALFRKQAAAGASEPDAEAAGSDPYQARLEAESWTLAEQVYGADAIEAYRAASDLIEQAVTPADYMAAFEAYHAIRSGEGPAPATSGRPSRAEATAPRVDTNRSDLGPDLQDAETKLSEARKGKSLADFTNAATARMGFGRGK